ncbi:MAG TPA: hypothetical protein VFX96_04175, partial [Pyrinomonadaceae bacterium]|nr:hypothetical protein [Pyrinomonadaceae bacterium]
MTDSMRRLAAVLVLACVVVCAAPHARGQETERRARKVDEFADIQLSDLMARLDYFANALTNEPGASGFIIVYRSRRDPEGLSGRVDDPMKRYLVESRGIPASRLATVDGGEASCFAVEFWLVPPGTAPTPRADAYTREFTDTESARKFDEYHYPLAHDDEGQPEIVLFGNSLEGFAAALHKQPRALGYV